jgi:hypothetical protein
MFDCPVCLFAEMPEPARDYHICPCCGTEFGNDDADCTHEELRDRWILAGAPWFFGAPPPGWSPQSQLRRPDTVKDEVSAMSAAAGAGGGASGLGYTGWGLAVSVQLENGPTFDSFMASMASQQSGLGELR